MLSASKSGSASGASGYNLTRSLRFRASASGYLSRTPASAGNQHTWTLNAWVKLSTTGNCVIYNTSSTGSSNTLLGQIYIYNNQLNIFQYTSSTTYTNLITTQVFRDYSASYMITVAYDDTQATASNRIKIYVNGTQVTSFSTATYPTQNFNSFFNGAQPTYFAKDAQATPLPYLDGYLAEVNFVDGSQLTPSSFGSTNAVTGVWQPAKYSGTYGTNGFYLPFTDNSALTTSSNVGLGKDFSGNGNYWTTNNISITAGVTYDSMTDVPTLTSATASNFAVLNPLDPSRSTLTNGNLTASGATDTPTIIPTSGTYYFEIDGVSKSWTPPAAFPAAAGNYNFGQRPFTNTPTGTLLNTYNLPTSTIVKGNTVMDATTYTGTLLSNAITNAASFKPDLVWIKSRSAATDHKLTDSVRGVTKGLISNTTGAETTDTQGLTAFGSAGFTVGTNTDYNNLAGSYVGWQWQAGQGSSSSNTSGSITSTVSVNASAGFSVVTYTGTGAAGTVGHGLGVAPSMIIYKQRSQISNWTVTHQSLGNMTTNILLLNSTAAVDTLTNTVAAPTSSTFGVSLSVAGSGQTCVAYCWTPIAGFSAFGSYTGNGSTDGVFVYTGFQPKWILLKRTDAGPSSWTIVDAVRDPYNVAQTVLYPNLSNAEGTQSALDILSNGFKLRHSTSEQNGSGATYIYAAFASNPFKNSLAR